MMPRRIIYYCIPRMNVLGRGGGGGYYGVVVVAPPRRRPETLHRLRDNLKNLYQIASIFYIYIYIFEWIAGKPVGHSLIIYGSHPPPPTNSQTFTFFAFGPIYETLVVICVPCYTLVCSVMRSYCHEHLVTLGSTYGPPEPPKYENNNILDLNLKSSYQIASLFHPPPLI